MSVLSDERLRRIAGECGPVTWEGGEFLKAWAVAYGRAVAEAAIAADRAARAEPVAYQVRFFRLGSTTVDTLVIKNRNDADKQIRREQILSIDPLYASPPAAPVPDVTSSVVNDAGWEFIKNIDCEVPGRVFNSIKPALYAALKLYHLRVLATTAPSQDPKP